MTQQRDEARDALSKISLYLSVGMGDNSTTAHQYYERIIEGIQMLTRPIMQMLEKAREQRDEARECLERCARAHCELGASHRNQIVKVENQRDRLRKIVDEQCRFSSVCCEYREQRDEARQEVAELKEEYGTWWAQKRIAIDELKDVTEQRDKLAEALRLATAYPLTESWYAQAIEALATLKL